MHYLFDIEGCFCKCNFLRIFLKTFCRTFLNSFFYLSFCSNNKYYNCVFYSNHCLLPGICATTLPPKLRTCCPLWLWYPILPHKYHTIVQLHYISITWLPYTCRLSQETKLVVSFMWTTASFSVQAIETNYKLACGSSGKCSQQVTP